MKKLLLISILLVLPLLLTACIKKPGQQDPQDTTGQQEQQQEQTNDDGSLVGSFVDILKMGKNIKCTGTVTDDEGTMDLTVYASGERSYTESEITSTEGETFEMFSIFDGEWFYNWGDMQPTATKMKVEEVDDLSDNFENAEPATDSTEDQTAGKMMEDMDYKCMPWIVDNSKFTPPADIEFVDVAEMMEEFSKSLENMDDTEMKQKICQACGLIPDAEQAAECKSTNNCE
jgi:major membrane immunogen (membrane-anchored lipoprotein)